MKKNKYAFQWDAYHPLRWPLWIEWLTDRCKNITLPQTSFVGGKYDETIFGGRSYSTYIAHLNSSPDEGSDEEMSVKRIRFIHFINFKQTC